MELDKLKNYYKTSHIRLPYDFSAVNKAFNSKYTAKQKLTEYLRKPYNEALEIVNINSPKCVARETAKDYAEVIQGYFKQTESEKQLLEKFNAELADNQDYYKMYDFDYFVDNVEIVKHDYRTNDGILKFVESFLEGSIEYTYNGFMETVNEMEEDINKRITEFYKTAHEEYLAYLEELVEKITVQ